MTRPVALLTLVASFREEGEFPPASLNVDRVTLKRFRATLYQIEKDGLAGKQWGQGTDLLQSIAGFANYVAMVNPTKGSEFLATVHRIQKKYGRRKR